jgi:hypothetical protein
MMMMSFEAPATTLEHVQDHPLSVLADAAVSADVVGSAADDEEIPAPNAPPTLFFAPVEEAAPALAPAPASMGSDSDAVAAAAAAAVVDPDDAPMTQVVDAPVVASGAALDASSPSSSGAALDTTPDAGALDASDVPMQDLSGASGQDGAMEECAPVADADPISVDAADATGVDTTGAVDTATGAAADTATGADAAADTTTDAVADTTTGAAADTTTGADAVADTTVGADTTAGAVDTTGADAVAEMSVDKEGGADPSVVPLPVAMPEKEEEGEEDDDDDVIEIVEPVEKAVEDAPASSLLPIHESNKDEAFLVGDDGAIAISALGAPSMHLGFVSLSLFLFFSFLFFSFKFSCVSCMHACPFPELAMALFHPSALTGGKKSIVFACQKQLGGVMLTVVLQDDTIYREAIFGKVRVCFKNAIGNHGVVYLGHAMVMCDGGGAICVSIARLVKYLVSFGFEGALATFTPRGTYTDWLAVINKHFVERGYECNIGIFAENAPLAPIHCIKVSFFLFSFFLTLFFFFDVFPLLLNFFQNPESGVFATKFSIGTGRTAVVLVSLPPNAVRGQTSVNFRLLAGEDTGVISAPALQRETLAIGNSTLSLGSAPSHIAEVTFQLKDIVSFSSLSLSLSLFPFFPCC